MISQISGIENTGFDAENQIISKVLDDINRIWEIGRPEKYPGKGH